MADGMESLDATPDVSSESLSADESGFENEQELTDHGGEARTLEDSGDQKKPEAKEAKPKGPRKLADADLDALVTVKVDGEVKEMTVRELQRLQSLEKASQKRMQEAAEERRKASQLIQLASTNPDKFFELTGIDPDEFAETRLARKYEMAMMSPEQRELMQLKAEKEEREQTEMQSKAEIISEIEKLFGQKVPPEVAKLPKEKLLGIIEKRQAEMSQEQNSLDTEIGEAWKESGLPKHRYFVQMMAAQMLAHQRKTKEPLQAKDAAAIVKRDFLKSVSEILGPMDAQAIQEAIGKETIEKLRSFDVERVTGRSASKKDVSPQRPGQAPASQKIQRTKTMNEFESREYFEKIKAELRD